jgi:hypothetical protein
LIVDVHPIVARICDCRKDVQENSLFFAHKNLPFSLPTKTKGGHQLFREDARRVVNTLGREMFTGLTNQMSLAASKQTKQSLRALLS